MWDLFAQALAKLGMGQQIPQTPNASSPFSGQMAPPMQPMSAPGGGFGRGLNGMDMSSGEASLLNEQQRTQGLAGLQQLFSGLKSASKSLGGGSGDFSPGAFEVPSHGSAQIVYPQYNQNPGVVSLRELMQLIAAGGGK